MIAYPATPVTVRMGSNQPLLPDRFYLICDSKHLFDGGFGDCVIIYDVYNFVINARYCLWGVAMIEICEYSR